jgi:VWFA-related protein
VTPVELEPGMGRWIQGPLTLAAAVGSLLLVIFARTALSQDRPLFTAEANLQSIAAEVTDRQGHAIRGLTAGDFTLLEDGRPQKIAFFGAEEQPVSLAVLADSSTSMRSGHKLEQVSEILPSLLRANLPGDEIYFAQFTDHVFPIRPLTDEERLHPPIRGADSRAGTAFYDALATALCTMRGARNLRQAVVVITDGADQHSRLTLDQLIRAAQAARPQIFTIGFFDKHEADIFGISGKMVTLVTSHEIDNPLRAFERISKESGAEAFFPASQRDLQKAVERILGILHAQYTLAYHTSRPEALRRIQVRVNRPGVVVASRRTVGSEIEDGGAAHFSTTSCEVSAKDHPYPWEPHVTHTTDGLTRYRDDFSDAHSGWPVHDAFRYTGAAYEISVAPPARGKASAAPERGERIAPPFGKLDLRVPGEVAAYGPWFTDFEASVEIQPPEDGNGDGGLIFRVNERGYYLLLLQRGKGASGILGSRHPIAYTLAKRFWSEPFMKSIAGWTPFQRSPVETTMKPGPVSPFVTAFVKCAGNRITVRIDGIEAISVTDDTFTHGQAGVGFFGAGHALFRNLEVQGVE